MEDRKRVGEEDQNVLEVIYEGFDFAKKRKKFFKMLIDKKCGKQKICQRKT